MPMFNPKRGSHVPAEQATVPSLVEQGELSQAEFDALPDQAKRNLTSQRVLSEIDRGLMTIERAKRLTAEELNILESSRVVRSFM